MYIHRFCSHHDFESVHAALNWWKNQPDRKMDKESDYKRFHSTQVLHWTCQVSPPCTGEWKPFLLLCRGQVKRFPTVEHWLGYFPVTRLQHSHCVLLCSYSFKLMLHSLPSIQSFGGLHIYIYICVGLELYLNSCSRNRQWPIIFIYSWSEIVTEDRDSFNYWLEIWCISFILLLLLCFLEIFYLALWEIHPLTCRKCLPSAENDEHY